MAFNSQQQLRSPITWFGGKGHMVEKLLSLMPPHKYYVEVFGGGASLLFGKKPVDIETYNDLNKDLFNFFSVLRNPIQFKELHCLASLTLMSRAEYNNCKEIWKECDDPVERAYKWFIVARLSFSGIFASGWSHSVTASVDCCSRLNNVVEGLPLIHERLRTVQIECNDWRKILEVYSESGYLAYLDPPYVHSTRKNGGYDHELGDQDHRDLIAAILKYPAMIMLSGYENDIYAPLVDAGWDMQKFNVVSTVALNKGKGSKLKNQPRVEVVWRNPAAMFAIEKGKGFQMELL